MKTLLVAVITAQLAIGAVSPVAAEGGKMRGSEGSGSVVQNQVMDPPPFQTP